MSVIRNVIRMSLVFLVTINLAFAGYHKGDKVVLVGTNNCPACVESMKELRANHIPFTKGSPSKYHAYLIPQLYVNGKYMGTGSDAVHNWIIS